jgi:hypothetical protein
MQDQSERQRQSIESQPIVKQQMMQPARNSEDQPTTILVPCAIVNFIIKGNVVLVDNIPLL